MNWLYMGLTVLIVPTLIEFVLKRIGIRIPWYLFSVIIGVTAFIAATVFQ